MTCVKKLQILKNRCLKKKKEKYLAGYKCVQIYNTRFKSLVLLISMRLEKGKIVCVMITDLAADILP